MVIVKHGTRRCNTILYYDIICDILEASLFDRRVFKKSESETNPLQLYASRSYDYSTLFGSYLLSGNLPHYSPHITWGNLQSFILGRMGLANDKYMTDYRDIFDKIKVFVGEIIEFAMKYEQSVKSNDKFLVIHGNPIIGKSDSVIGFTKSKIIPALVQIIQVVPFMVRFNRTQMVTADNTPWPEGVIIIQNINANIKDSVVETDDEIFDVVSTTKNAYGFFTDRVIYYNTINKDNRTLASLDGILKVVYEQLTSYMTSVFTSERFIVQEEVYFSKESGMTYFQDLRFDDYTYKMDYVQDITPNSGFKVPSTQEFFEDVLQ